MINSVPWKGAECCDHHSLLPSEEEFKEGKPSIEWTPKVEKMEMEVQLTKARVCRRECWRGESCRESCRERENLSWVFSRVLISAYLWRNFQRLGRKSPLKGLERMVSGAYKKLIPRWRKPHNSLGIGHSIHRKILL